MIDTSKNNIDGFVDVFVNLSTGEIHLGNPYTSEENRPEHLPGRYKFLGTANLKFSMELKTQPKFKAGDKVIIYDETPAVILAVDPMLMKYTIKVPDDYVPSFSCFYGPGVHDVEFAINGWMVKV